MAAAQTTRTRTTASNVASWRDVTPAGIVLVGGPEEYLGIFFSGGRAPEYIREDEDLLRITRWFFDNNKPCGSVCHGVEIPARADRVRGRRMATVAKCQFDLEVCGGIYVNEPSVVDGNLVSGRTFHDNGHFVKHWIALLEEEAKKRA